MKTKLLRGAAKLAALLFWLVVWYFLAKKVDLPFVLPSPIEVGKRFGELAVTPEFYQSFSDSLLRVVYGYGAGLLFGFVLGALAYRFSFVSIVLSPVMSVVRATPVASFILVVFLWIGQNEVPIFISFLMVLPIVFQNTYLGFQKRDRQLSEMAKVFRFGFWKTVIKVDLPQILPFFFSSAKTGMGLAWKAGIAAEVLALPIGSVGMMIYNSKMYLETVDLYAWTLGIIIISVILEKLFSLLFFQKKGGSHAIR